MAKNVIITGVSAGIGKACAELFVREGWSVIGVASRKDPGLEGIKYYQCDLSKHVNIKRLASEVRKDFGSIDCIVNNAAYQVTETLDDTTEEQWDKVMNVNLKAIYLLGRELIDAMNDGGSIVNVSSVHAIATSSRIAAYAASKGAIMSLTRAMAIDLADRDIRVNTVLPGAVDTKMLRNGLSRGHAGDGDIQEKLDCLAERTVIGRIGKPEEIAEAIFFLADGKRSSFITGASLVVDGGATTRLSTE